MPFFIKLNHCKNYGILQGHYVRDLGDCGDKATENEVLLLEHDIPHQPFSQQVLDDLPKMPWIITEKVRFKIYECETSTIQLLC